MAFTATVFNTETPGLNQPGILQIAAVTVDENYEVISKFSTYLKPELWTKIEEGAFLVHGIDQTKCEKYGIPLNNGLAILKNLFDTTDVCVAYNANFDIRVIDKALNLLGKESIFTRRRTFDPMLALTDICKIPGRYPGKYKWPKLVEAHEFLFGEGFDAAHDALADVMATVRVMQGIKQKFPELLSRV